MERNSNPPEKPSDNGGGGPGGGASGSSSSVSYTGATTLSTDQNVEQAIYKSTNGAENALLVNGGNITLTMPEITKSGDDSGDSSDFYGTNAAVLVYNGATLNITGGTVTTNGGHANAVFAYGSGTINIDATTINTTGNNSGGVMVTGGGTLNAKNLNVTTSGNSSAAIRSDRGGGTMNIDGGSYETSGVGSPAIYSTADVRVNGATLVATTSEGVVIEGDNSVSLENATMTATNHQNNGHSETFKTIFIYQSMSGDADEGVGTFTAKGSLIATNSGDHFFVTNTTAVINLEANQFVQEDANGVFLRAQTGYWGSAGKNGGKVTLNATSQEINGDMVIDSISSLELNLTHSYFKGALVGEGAKTLKVSTDSVVVLTADSYVNALENENTTNSNIYANGHKLYVNGEEVTLNQDAAPASFLNTDVTGAALAAADATTTSTRGVGMPVWGYFAAVLGGLVLVAVILTFVFKRKGKKK